MKKRLLAILLCVLLVIGALPLSAAAAGEDVTCQSATINFNGQTYTVGFGFTTDNGPQLYSADKNSSGPSNWLTTTPDRYSAWNYPIMALDSVGAIAENVTVKVTALELASVSGDADTFSLSADSSVKGPLTGDFSMPYFYSNNTKAGVGLLTATVCLTADDQTSSTAQVKLRVTVEEDRHSGGGGGGQGGGEPQNTEESITHQVGDNPSSDGWLTVTSSNEDVVRPFTDDRRNSKGYECVAEGKADVTITTAGGTIIRHITVIAASGGGGGGGQGEQPIGCESEFVTLGGTEYEVGFGDVTEGAIAILNWRYSGPMANTYAVTPDPDEAYTTMFASSESVLAATPLEDGYSEATGVTVTITKLKLVNLSTVEGEEQSFSLSADSFVNEKTSSIAPPYFYLKSTHPGYVRIVADVTVTKGGDSANATVSMCVKNTRTTVGTVLNRPEDDTLAQLNTDLAAIAKDMTDDSERLTINLAPTTYEGTVEVPSGFRNKLTLVGSQEGEPTVIKGGVNLAARAGLRYIDFVAPAAGDKRAVYGCSGSVMFCSFRGYDVAVDASEGTIPPIWCTFENNTVAAQIDIEDNRENNDGSPWMYNTFKGNGTAVKIISLHTGENAFISPYYFRVANCNFLDNTTDFNLVPASTTVYMYRNFYGTKTGSAAAVSRTPNITVGSGSSVVTDPRWDKEVTNVDQNGEPVGLKLVADWIGGKTTVVNEDADQLAMDPSAFTAAGDKTVYVTTQQGAVTSGVWNFASPVSSRSAQAMSRSASEPVFFSARTFASASSASSGFNVARTFAAGSSSDFNAGLTFGSESNGDVSVTVKNSTVLSTYSPTLTVPVDKTWTEAFVIAPNGSKADCTWSESDKEMTFTVTAGGKYLIREGDGEDYVPPASGTSSGGSSVETEENTTVDGASQTIETAADGTVTTETTWEDGKTAVSVTSPEGDTTVKVTSPDGEVMAEINLPGETPETDKTFVDVKEKDWFNDSVYEAAALGLFSGTSETRFSPKAELDRSMLVKVLYNLSGAPDYGTGENVFGDVPDNVWYTDAADWASAMGVAAGTGKGFEPTAKITRQDMISMLYRYAMAIGADPSETGTLARFRDGKKVSAYAVKPLEWAVAAGIISGKGHGVLDPKGTATRAEAAVMLVKFVEYLKKH